MGVNDFIERQSRPQQQLISESQRIGAMSRGDHTLVRPTQGRPFGVDTQNNRQTQSWPNEVAKIQLSGIRIALLALNMIPQPAHPFLVKETNSHS